MLFALFVPDSETAGTDGEAEHREIRLFLDEAVTDGILVFLLMLSEIAHIKVFLVTAFNLTDIFLSSFLVFQMDLDMLFEVCSRRKRLTAFFTDERLFLSVNAPVSVQIRFLIEPLLAVFEIALVRLNSFVNEFMPLESGFCLEGAVTVFVLAFKLLFFISFMMARLYLDVVVLIAGHAVVVFLAGKICRMVLLLLKTLERVEIGDIEMDGLRKGVG